MNRAYKEYSGLWIRTGDGSHVCAVCGERIPHVVVSSSDFDHLYPKCEEIDLTDFCPNCGAYMRQKLRILDDGMVRIDN